MPKIMLEAFGGALGRISCSGRNCIVRPVFVYEDRSKSGREKYFDRHLLGSSKIASYYSIYNLQAPIGSHSGHMTTIVCFASPNISLL